MRTQTWFYIRRGIIIVPAGLYRSAGKAISTAAELGKALKLKAVVLPGLQTRRNRGKPAT